MPAQNPNPVVRKLSYGAALTPEDVAAVLDACSEVRDVPAGVDLIVEGAEPEKVHAVISGFACRYKTLADGGRQIMAWLIPGDFCDLHVAVLGVMDHAIRTLAPSRVAFIDPEAVPRLTSTSPTLSRALWWATLVDEGVLREWLANMGRRSAERQVAHLFCELLERYHSIGMAADDAVDLPLTQAELADTAGLSTVHVNRVLQHLRERELISWSSGCLRILDAEALRAYAGFDPNYLHLDRAPPAAPLAEAGRTEATGH